MILLHAVGALAAPPTVGDVVSACNARAPGDAREIPAELAATALGTNVPVEAFAVADLSGAATRLFARDTVELSALTVTPRGRLKVDVPTEPLPRADWEAGAAIACFAVAACFGPSKDVNAVAELPRRPEGGAVWDGWRVACGRGRHDARVLVVERLPLP